MENKISDRMKEKLLWFGIILGILFLCVFFVVRYRIVNSRVSEKIYRQEVEYGQNYEIDGVVYKVGNSPKWNREYDKDYKMDIYKYRVPVCITNKSKKQVSVFDAISEYCLLSGGSVWYGNTENCEKDTLTGGESLAVEIYFDVIPEEGIKLKLYENAKLYDVIPSGKNKYKIGFH